MTAFEDFVWMVGELCKMRHREGGESTMPPKR